MEVIHDDCSDNVRCNTTTSKFYYILHSCMHAYAVHMYPCYCAIVIIHIHKVFKELKEI